MSTPAFRVRITAKDLLTPSICRFELRAVDGAPLPTFTVGAHLTVHTPGGPTRSYSLTGEPAERDRYVIAVAREDSGRGGSVSLLDDTAVGDELLVSAPSNSFELVPSPRYLLIAGGIGITPIRAMFRQLRRHGSEVRLVYLTRSPEQTAFLDEFTVDDDAVVLHHSGAGRLDLWPFLAEPRDDTRIYCCGPEALLADVRALTMHWRPSRVHVEDFTGVSGTDGTASPFRATWRPTGRTVEVPADRTLLDALREAAIDVPSSCESGTCGTCRVRLFAGAAEHRDLVLDDEQRSRYLMPCVSRAATEWVEIGPDSGTGDDYPARTDNA
ncbi:PDR/VanB family oxidoreductase [Prauserella cavernicola]|uniref:Oxidoreductase n=1 Tax=Prauserella cavernicola TaxID=2800127 RepID=A0A934QU61_9PSEU|nr:PDR/VanB family oxidoreductase [Prauserella cavernicola]MBK1788302.1 oxidoreductase [Prauserella cavernicola]